MYTISQRELVAVKMVWCNVYGFDPVFLKGWVNLKVFCMRFVTAKVTTTCDPCWIAYCHVCNYVCYSLFLTDKRFDQCMDEFRV